MQQSFFIQLFGSAFMDVACDYETVAFLLGGGVCDSVSE